MSLFVVKLINNAKASFPSQHNEQQHTTGTISQYNSTANNNTNKSNVRILACSVSSSSGENVFALIDRKLCEDRKEFFEHLQPANITKSTLRLTLMQATHFLSNYMTDQLKLDFERDERVAKGEITQEQADQDAEEWEKTEWTKRWEVFPEKLASALFKYHAIVLVMRLYEYIAEKANLISEVTLDSLTRDTFKASRLELEKLGGRVSSVGSGGSATSIIKNSKDLNNNINVEYGKQMYRVCQSANIIAYLADYSVHQILLCWGYYVYISEHNKRLQKKREERKQSSQDKKDSDEDEKQNDVEELAIGSLGFSLLTRSTLLFLSRGVGLVFASGGGAVGSIIWPGWGTLAGTNLGDSLAGVCLDELNVSSPTVSSNGNSGGETSDAKKKS